MCCHDEIGKLHVSGYLAPCVILLCLAPSFRSDVSSNFNVCLHGVAGVPICITRARGAFLTTHGFGVARQNRKPRTQGGSLGVLAPGLQHLTPTSLRRPGWEEPFQLAVLHLRLSLFEGTPVWLVLKGSQRPTFLVGPLFLDKRIRQAGRPTFLLRRSGSCTQFVRAQASSELLVQ